MSLGNVLNEIVTSVWKRVYHIPATGISNPVGALTIGGSKQGAMALKNNYLEGNVPAFYAPFIVYTLRGKDINGAYIGPGNGDVLYVTQQSAKLMTKKPSSGERLDLNTFFEVLHYVGNRAAYIRQIAYLNEIDESSEVTIKVPIKSGIEALINSQIERLKPATAKIN